MIDAVLIVNTDGFLRLAKIYDKDVVVDVVRTLYDAVSCREISQNNFFQCEGRTVVYRHYATLYFIFVVENDTESVLGILDLIQVFVQSLDRCFENVCELDIIFNSEKVHYVLDEMIVGGIVVDTSMNSVLEAVRECEVAVNSVSVKSAAQQTFY